MGGHFPDNLLLITLRESGPEINHKKSPSRSAWEMESVVTREESDSSVTNLRTQFLQSISENVLLMLRFLCKLPNRKNSFRFARGRSDGDLGALGYLVLSKRGKRGTHADQ
ncbi:hypothetical protein FRC03_000371 [Tulasnella sp. 419]|nr:hypothetical protein FRC03_000371 [Tulasnella sp. 419]